MSLDTGVRCPHCDRRNLHVSEEFPGQEGEWDTTCEHCGETFKVSRKIEISYKAWKLERDASATDGEEDGKP